MGKRRAQRLLPEPESSSEFVTPVEGDRGYLSAPQSSASRLPFRSTTPLLVAHLLQDDGDYCALGEVNREFRKELW